MNGPHSNLERELLNHYPSGSLGTAAPSFHGSRRPFRMVGLPAWQIGVIQGHPSLYNAEEEVGISDYCHLALGFEVDAEWADLIEELSDCGSWLVQILRASSDQADAKIAVVRVREIGGRLGIGASDNLHAPYREFWRSCIHWIEAQPPKGE